MVPQAAPSIREALRFVQRTIRAGLPPAPGDETDRRAQAEAEQLLEAALGMDRLAWLTRMAEPMPAPAWAQLQAWTQRRAAGEPLQYILGRAPFYGREFVVRPGVLIPRPETECVAEAAIRWISRWRPDARVTDLGTGSGVLAVTIAREWPQAQVTAIDVSPAALAVARENAQRLGAHGVLFIEADGRAWLRDAAARGELAVLVSNPPYIPRPDLDRLHPEVRCHEPRLALDGGPDGLDWYRMVQDAGPGLFAPGPAALFLELGAGQAEAVLALFRADPRWAGWCFAVTPDLRGIPRVLTGTREV